LIRAGTYSSDVPVKRIFSAAAIAATVIPERASTVGGPSTLHAAGSGCCP
jgi:hypothetical protein